MLLLSCSNGGVIVVFAEVLDWNFVVVIDAAAVVVIANVVVVSMVHGGHVCLSSQIGHGLGSGHGGAAV